jgi:transcriptional regulator with XRE-family HTH domain
MTGQLHPISSDGLRGLSHRRNTLKGPAPMRLQDLIRTRKQELRLTWAQLAQRAEDAGHPISNSMLHHWAGNAWPNIPPTEALRALAAALGVDVDVILEAAAASLDLRMKEVQVDPNARALIALVQERTPAQVAALERILRTVVEEMDTGSGSQRPRPP